MIMTVCESIVSGSGGERERGRGLTFMTLAPALMPASCRAMVKGLLAALDEALRSEGLL